MPITYQNKKADTYYLISKKTKKGKKRYYFTKHPRGELVEKFPQGYEIYENTYGQVFLKKKTSQSIPSAEKRALEQIIKANFEEDQYFLEVVNNAIVIYQADLEGLLSLNVGQGQIELNDFSSSEVTYTPVYKIELRSVDKEKKYRLLKHKSQGTLSSWQYIGSSEDIQKLIINNIEEIRELSKAGLRFQFE